MIDPRVQSLCDEFGVEIIPAHRYPEIGQTRAVRTILRIIRRHGEEHARWVLRTLVETSNNKAMIDETGLWAASDLVLAYWADLQADPEAWFQVWDQMSWISVGLRSATNVGGSARRGGRQPGGICDTMLAGKSSRRRYWPPALSRGRAPVNRAG